jgi:predicted MPP superfamily phosphohydrolase
MDTAPALIAFRERVAAASETAILAALVVGELCLYCDLAGRVLGTYVRTWRRIVVRGLIVLLAGAALAVPFVLAVTDVGGLQSFWLVLSTLLSVVVTVNFLFPYRFGIRRINDEAGVTEERALVRGITLRRVAVEMRLPSASPASLRCLILTDLHCTFRFNLVKLLASLAALPDPRCDMVFVLGDLGENSRLLPEVVRAIAGLRPRYGVFCVRGNHDLESDRPKLIADLAKENSIILLSSAAYTVPGLGVQIVGLDCPWHGSVLPSRREGGFAIGLTHTPDNIKVFSRLDVPLALAGHTHGGKIRLPGIGSFPVPSKYGRFLDEGWFQFAGTRLYVTPGIGHFPGLLGKQGVIVELTITDTTRAAG